MLISLRFLATMLFTILSAGAGLLVFWQLQLRAPDQGWVGSMIAVLGALLAAAPGAVVASPEERALCYAVAAAPTLLVLSGIAIAALTGGAPLVTIAQFALFTAVTVWVVRWLYRLGRAAKSPDAPAA